MLLSKVWPKSKVRVGTCKVSQCHFTWPRLVRALHNYKAQDEDELSFPRGCHMKILRRSCQSQVGHCRRVAWGGIITDCHFLMISVCWLVATLFLRWHRWDSSLFIFLRLRLRQLGWSRWSRHAMVFLWIGWSDGLSFCLGCFRALRGGLCGCAGGWFWTHFETLFVLVYVELTSLALTFVPCRPWQFLVAAGCTFPWQNLLFVSLRLAAVIVFVEKAWLVL